MALIISASVCNCGEVAPRHVENVFLDDRAVDVVRAVAQCDLCEFQAEADPIRRDVVEVVEVDAADGDGAQRIKSGRRVFNGNVVVVAVDTPAESTR